MRRLLLALFWAEVFSHCRDHPLKVQIRDARRAGGPAGAARYGWAPYEFIGGDDVGLVFYPGAAVEAAAYAPLCRRVAEEAKALSRDLECHVVVPVRLF